MIKIWLFSGAVLALALTTRLPAASLEECAAIEDDQRRLACFDEATRAPSASQPATPGAADAVATPAPVIVPVPAQVTEPTPVPTSSASISGTPATDSGTAAAIVPTPAPAAPQAVAEKPHANSVDPTSSEYDELFGLENQVTTKGMQQIQSRIMNPFEGWGKDTVFELENGQVWMQSDNNSSFSYRGGPQPVATIKKGYFGSFQLKVEGFNKRVRVKRVR